MKTRTSLPLARRQELFRRLVELQDAGVAVDESRQVVATEFGVSVDLIDRVIEQGIAADWPLPDAE